MQTSAPQFRGCLSSICEILPRILIDQPDQCSLLDLYGDSAEHHGKYVRMKIAQYTCLDDSEKSVRDNEKRWMDRTRGTIKGEFYCLDLCRHQLLSHQVVAAEAEAKTETEQLQQNELNERETRFLDRVKRGDVRFDHAVCYSVKFEHAFRTRQTAEHFFDNASRMLKVGGYLFGYCFDSSSAWTLFQKEITRFSSSSSSGGSSSNSMMNRSASSSSVITVKKSNFVLTFSDLEQSTTQGSASGAESGATSTTTSPPVTAAQVADTNQEQDLNFATFGTRYELKIDTEPVKRCGYFIHFPSLIQMAEQYGFRVISLDNMQQFYEDYKDIYHDTFNGYMVYKKHRNIMPNDMNILSLFNIFILQKVK